MKRRTQGTNPVRVIGALSAVAALTMTGMVAVPAVAAPGDGTLTVEVNRDFSGDGLYEPAFDPGQEGIDVTLTDGTTTVGPLTTNADGQVAFDLSTLAGSRFRVDVTIPATAPDYLEFAPASATISADSFRSATTFVDGTTQTIHVGVWNPNTYVTRNPQVAIAQQKERGTSAATRSLMVTDWNNRGPFGPADVVNDPILDNTTGLRQVASQGETGTVFGTAWDYRSNSLFSAAYAKAYTRYGPGGNGAIYRTDTSTANTTGNTVVWATIPNAGTSVHETTNGHDAPFFLAAGSEGLGGLALSDDGATLYAVNLNDKTLYSLDTTAAAPAAATAVAVIGDPGCVGGDWRPFAVTQRDGEVYVGGICDASTSLSRADLQVSILKLEGSAFTEVYSHALDFIRGSQAYPDPVPNYTDSQVALHWNPWRDAWADDLTAAMGEAQPPGSVTPIYPMPLLTSFAFENDGSLILDFRDRKTDALVADGYAPDGVTLLRGHVAAGDLNKVCLTAGVYEWEGTGACPNNATPANSAQPAGRVEFFPGEFMTSQPRYGTNIEHTENALGAVLLSPREKDIISTTMNPTQLYNSGGLGWYDRVDGTGPGNDWQANALLIAGNDSPGNFAKGSGLGGVSLLASPAPIQVGNYVWFDADHDGEQDADEVPIAGVTVNIYSADGSQLLGTVTTNENGEYYFGGEGGLALEPGTEYIIEFDLSTAQTSTLPGSPTPGDLSYTKVQEPGAGSTHDSNPTPQANPSIGRATITTPDHAGGVDHTIDAGVYYTLPGIDIVKFDGRQPAPANPVDGPDAPDGTYAGPTTGSWDPAVDADTEADAVEYPLTDGSTGPQQVSMIVTNTGNVAISDVNVEDTTVQGPAVTGLSCDFSPLGGPATGTTWAGPLEPDASFLCTGTLTMGPEQIHENVASVEGQPLDVDGEPFGPTIGDEDQYWATTPADTRVPGIDIVKFDGRQTPPANPVDGPDAVDGAYSGPTTGDWGAAVDADTQDDAVQYPLTDGSTGPQPVHMIVTNTGEMPLGDVSVADLTLDGPAVTGLTCDFSPLGGPSTGTTWDGPFAVGASFTCVGTLTMGASEVHNDIASVSGQPLDFEGEPTGEPVGDEDSYWAETPADDRAPAIDIVKFDGRQAAPENPVDGPDAVDGAYSGATPGDWDPAVDADTQADAVQYPLTDGVTGPQPVGMIVTNTGNVSLADVSVADLTLEGPALTGVTCDFSPLGGPATGTTWAGPFLAGDSFSCTGTLAMGASEVHNDIASVTGQPIDSTGEPFGPTVGDEDGYWAETPADDRAPAIDIVKFDGRQAAPENPVDGPDAVDGEYSGPTTGDWDAAVDADTQADAVQYPLTDGSSGPQPVGMIITNTGNVSLAGISVSDLTLQGSALTGVTCDFSPLGGPATGTTWAGPFLAGDSFSCTGTLAMGASEVHNDIASVTGQPIDSTGEPFGPTVGDEDGYWAETPADDRAPAIDIVKFDGRQAAPENPVDGPDAVDGTYGGPTTGDWTAGVDADTEADAVEYPLTAGTSGPQPVGMIITNTGNVSLADVSVADLTLQGSALTGVTCDFSPLGGPATGTTWSGPFLAGDSFSCTGTLTMGASEVHNDIASVTGQPIDSTGEPFGSTVGDEDGYWATTPADTRAPGIDIVKFDGRQSAPENPVDGPDAVDGEYGGPTTGDWDAAVDADTQDDAVQYPITDGTTGPQPVGVIVTNTGELALADVSVSDLTKLGSDITGLTCDFSPLGGPASGTSWDGPFQPGDSFSCTATLTMGASEVHNDIASVTGQPVDNDGQPVGEPVGDEDGYWAETPQNPTPSLEITKRQAETGDEADTADDAIEATAGEAVHVEMPVTNTGSTPLTQVVVSDHTDDGPAMTEFACEFPDGTVVPAVDGAVRWAATFTDPATASWQPGVTFTCTGVVTLGADETHADTVTVTAVAPDGTTLTDDNPFHVKTPPVEPTPTPTSTPTVTPTPTPTEPSTPAPTTPAPTTSAPSTPVPTISVGTPGVPNLPSTGAAISTGVLVAGTLLLGLGLVIVLARRRSTQR